MLTSYQRLALLRRDTTPDLDDVVQHHTRRYVAGRTDIGTWVVVDLFHNRQLSAEEFSRVPDGALFQEFGRA